MLIISRRTNERIILRLETGEKIVLMLTECASYVGEDGRLKSHAKIGIEAPQSVTITREPR